MRKLKLSFGEEKHKKPKVFISNFKEDFTMINSAIDGLMDIVEGEIIEFYSHEIVKDEKYQELEKNTNELINKICEEHPELRKKVIKLEHAMTEMFVNEYMFYYKRGISDGVRINKALNQFL